MSAAARLPTDLPELLRAELQLAALPQWHRAWTPQLSYGRHRCRPRAAARPAAVAVILCRDQQGWTLPLTVRSKHLVRHGGQVSFPGGLIDPHETVWEAAHRELEEELGSVATVDWLGTLEPLWVFASNVAVTPCVGWLSEWPTWHPNPTEVEAVLRLSLAQLLEERREFLVVDRTCWTLRAPCLWLAGESVWGSTAVMLGELRGRLLRVLGSAP